MSGTPIVSAGPGLPFVSDMLAPRSPDSALAFDRLHRRLGAAGPRSTAASLEHRLELRLRRASGGLITDLATLLLACLARHLVGNIGLRGDALDVLVDVAHRRFLGARAHARDHVAEGL